MDNKRHRIERRCTSMMCYPALQMGVEAQRKPQERLATFQRKHSARTEETSDLFVCLRHKASPERVGFVARDFNPEDEIGAVTGGGQNPSSRQDLEM